MALNFPTSRNGWRLDVVSLLAVIGESSMSKHAQPLTASWLCLLPRLIPAPQALISPSRPTGLPSQVANVVGVHSGNYLQELNYFANLIHPIQDLRKHSVYEVSIEHRPLNPSGHKKDSKTKENEFKEIVTRRFSFLNCLTVGSTLLTIGLLVWSVINKDGAAFVAILVLSVTSSLVGLASSWHPRVTKRDQKSDVPPGDIVIRTRNGAFVIVHCSEEVARELYVGAEDCSYVLGTRTAQILVGTSTILLMFGVVLVGNCTFEMQLALGASYIILNGLYWVAALLPPRQNWDLRTRYEWTDPITNDFKSYTDALHQAILAASRNGEHVTGEIKTSWVGTSRAAPDTTTWKKWLAEVAVVGQRAADGKVPSPTERWKAIQKMDQEERGIKPDECAEPIQGVLRRPTGDFEERK